MGRPRKDCPPDVVPLLEGHSAKEIAKIAGVSPVVAQRWRNEHGATPFKGGRLAVWAPGSALSENFTRMWLAGEPTSVLRAVFKISRQRVAQIRVQLGLQPRPEVDGTNRERPLRPGEPLELDEALCRALVAARPRVVPEGLADLAGTMFDVEVARKCGTTRSVVAAYRRRNHIAPWAAQPACRLAGRWAVTCRRSYELRALDGRKWADIEAELGVSNACRAAKVHATRHDLPWPIFKV